MTLEQACELLVMAYRKGNAVDFWRAVAMIEQVLQRLKRQQAGLVEDDTGTRVPRPFFKEEQ